MRSKRCIGRRNTRSVPKRDAINEQVQKVRSFAKCEIPMSDADDMLWERSGEDDGNESTTAS